MLLRKGLSLARGLPRATRMLPAALGQRGMASLNMPKSTMQEPPFAEDPAVPRLGKAGPVYNEDVKTSTVELSEACEFS